MATATRAAVAQSSSHTCPLRQRQMRGIEREVLFHRASEGLTRLGDVPVAGVQQADAVLVERLRPIEDHDRVARGVSLAQLFQPDLIVGDGRLIQSLHRIDGAAIDIEVGRAAGRRDRFRVEGVREPQLPRAHGDPRTHRRARPLQAVHQIVVNVTRVGPAVEDTEVHELHRPLVPRVEERVDPQCAKLQRVVRAHLVRRDHRPLPFPVPRERGRPAHQSRHAEAVQGVG
jgi:hypothetical protein